MKFLKCPGLEGLIWHGVKPGLGSRDLTLTYQIYHINHILDNPSYKQMS